MSTRFQREAEAIRDRAWKIITSRARQAMARNPRLDTIEKAVAHVMDRDETAREALRIYNAAEAEAEGRGTGDADVTDALWKVIEEEAEGRVRKGVSRERAIDDLLRERPSLVAILEALR